jgi:hypothetical protein
MLLPKSEEKMKISPTLIVKFLLLIGTASPERCAPAQKNPERHAFVYNPHETNLRSQKKK